MASEAERHSGKTEVPAHRLKEDTEAECLSQDRYSQPEIQGWIATKWIKDVR
jgi:hypothetical protein